MKVSLITDIGQKRSSNQDYINKYENRAGLSLIILADGMGGHRAGNVASEFTVTEFGKLWVDTDYDDLAHVREWLLHTLSDVNQKVFNLGQHDDYRGMGTTVEAVVVVGQTMIYAHVGDSRISLIREGSYTQLTSDHSLVNALVQAGQLTVEEAESHPQKNIITQSIGQEHPVEADLAVKPLLPGDILLINSDGLTNMVDSEAILATLTNSTLTLDDKASALVNQANAAGGLDNITIGLLEIESEDVA